MRNLFRSALSFLAIAFWIAVCYGGTILGLVVWPMLVQEYANVGMPLSRGEILGTGILLIPSWPVFGLTGLWLHFSSAERERIRAASDARHGAP